MTLLPNIQKSQVMRQVKTWCKSQRKDTWLLNVTIVLAIVLGCLVGYFYSAPLNKWMANMDMTGGGFNFYAFGLTASAVLFIGGYIKGRLKL